MAIRQFNFTSGPETAALPTVEDPSGPDDLVTLGFADARYTQGSEAVADNAALKAIAEAERRDGDFVLIKDSNRVYRFDSASALADDANFVLAPDAGTGRWIRLTLLNQANTFTQDQIIDANLTVNGTTTTVDSETLDVKDPNIGVNRGGNQATANTNVSGFTVQMTDATNAQVGYDSSLASKFKAGEVGSESEIITAGTAQTFTGIKTFDEEVIHKQNTTPANPAATFNKLYFKSDNGLYKLDSSGNELELSDFPLLDEDDMVSDSATSAPSQQSTKAYVDNEIASLGTALNADINAVSANYTILDGDGYRHIHVTTGATDRTITLPLAANNTDRIISIKKVDSGAGKVTIDGNGSETIDGQTTLEFVFQNDWLELVCNGTSWFINSGVESARLDVSSTGSFNASQPTIRATRIGQMINLTIPPLAHSSSSNPSTGAAFVPSRFRTASSNMRNAMFNLGATAVVTAGVRSDGTFELFYADWAGAGTAQTTSQVSGSISYQVG